MFNENSHTYSTSRKPLEPQSSLGSGEKYLSNKKEAGTACEIIMVTAEGCMPSPSNGDLLCTTRTKFPFEIHQVPES